MSELIDYEQIGISKDDIVLFEEVFRNKILIVDYNQILIHKKFTIISIEHLCGTKMITKNKKKYFISMLISCYGLKILFKKGYYITEKYFIKHNKYTNKIFITHTKLIPNFYTSII